MLASILSKTILPPQVYPENLEPEHQFIFDAYLNDPIPGLEIKPMHPFRGSADGVLMRYGKILIEGSPYYFQRNHPIYVQYQKYPGLKPYIKRLLRYYFLYPKEVLKIPCVWLTDSYSHFFYHWIAETLPRIFLWHSIDSENQPIILPKRYLRIGYIKESLDFFSNRNFIFLEDNKLYKFQHASYISPMGKPYQFSPTLLEGYKKYMIEQCFSNNVRPESKVYISRAKARKRKILNEYDVNKAFESFGYETVFMEELSFKNQIMLASSADKIAGLHGAGLVNMIFQPDNAVALEIQRYLNWPSCFFRLANAIGCKYYYLYCKHYPEDHPNEHADVYVDIAKLENVLACIKQTQDLV